MEFALILVKQILIMFILMAIGFVFFKKKWITTKGSGEIGSLLLHLVIPLVIINSFWMDKSAEKTALIIDSCMISLIAMAISVVVSTVIFGKRDGIGCFSSAFSNAGFIGIPLIQAVLGAEAISYISIMIVLINLLQWTYGVFTITGDKSVMNPRKIVTNPIVISVVIGLLIYFLEIPKVEIAETLITNITNINTPLAMMVSGVQLAQSDLLAMLKKKNTWLVCVIRLILIPFIVLLVFKVLPMGSEDMKLAIMIASACPVGANVAIFAQQYNKNYTEAVEQVCLSTLLCLVTLPIIVTIANTLL